MEKKLTPEELGNLVAASAKFWWAKLYTLYPVIGPHIPKIKYNKRLKTTAGRAFYAAVPQYVDLSVELLWEYPDEMLNDTIPHELAHLAAFTVYGDSGHGPSWKKVMREIGLEPSRCHNMINTRHEARKMK